MRCEEEEDELCFRRRHAVNKWIVVVNVNLSLRWVKHIPCSSNLQHPYECSLKFYQRYLVEYLITSLEHNARNSYFALLGPGAYPNSKIAPLQVLTFAVLTIETSWAFLASATLLNYDSTATDACSTQLGDWRMCSMLCRKQPCMMKRR